MKTILTCLLTSLLVISTFSSAATADNLNDFEFNDVPPLIQEYLGSSKRLSLKKLKQIKLMIDKYHKNNNINDYTYKLISNRIDADIQLASLELRKPVDSINYGEGDSGIPEESPHTSKKVTEVKLETKKQKNEKLIKEKEAQNLKKEQESVNN